MNKDEIKHIIEEKAEETAEQVMREAARYEQSGPGADGGPQANEPRVYSEPEPAERRKMRKLAVIMIAVLIAVSAGLYAACLGLGTMYVSSGAKDSAEKFARVMSSAGTEVNLGDALRKKTVKYVQKQEEIPAYTYDQVQAMDMSKPSGVTVEDLKQVTRYKLVGTEETLYNLEQEYNLNCLLLLAIASHESAYGTMQFHPNNVCGYGYSGFASIDECLDTVGRVLAKNYLDPSGPYYKGNTIEAVNKTYAADPAWDSKVARKVAYFYEVISANHNSRLEKLN